MQLASISLKHEFSGMDFEVLIQKHIETQYGITVLSIERITKGVVNESYKVVTNEAAYIFRVYTNKNVETVQFEVDVLRKLATSDFVSPHIIPCISGEYILDFDERPSVLCTYIEGDIKETLTCNELTELGRQLATLHELLGNFEPTVKKGTWEPDVLVSLYKEKGRTVILTSHTHDAKEVVAFCDEYLTETTFNESLPKGITHQDVKHENVIVRDGTVVGIIDFDNAYYGTLLYDLLTTVMWEGYNGSVLQGERVTAIISGYQSVRALTQNEKDYIYEALKLRLLREVFIGPYAAVHGTDVALTRSREFMDRFYACDESVRVLLEEATKT